jgi:arsenate reductase (thioredoxin)
MLQAIHNIVDRIDFDSITSERKSGLDKLVVYIKKAKKQNQAANLNFICTHNSRRSQFAQLWATLAAWRYGVDAHCFSGGVEITACNQRTVDSLLRFGFLVTSVGNENPHFQVQYATNQPPVVLFSKLYDDSSTPTSDFAAIMTCSHADENCPFIPGCDVRIAVRYNDPKQFDDSTIEHSMYDATSFTIASEMMYVFSQINDHDN